MINQEFLNELKRYEFFDTTQDYYFKIRESIRKSINEFKLGFSDEFKKTCRREYLENQIEDLEKNIKETIFIGKRAKENKCPIWWLNYLKEYYYFPECKKLEKLKNSLRFIDYKNKDGITSEMIISAKEFPIGELIEINSAGFSLCPAHEDKNPSLFCKNNFVYCFVCGYTADSISLASKLWGTNFIETVKKLSCG